MKSITDIIELAAAEYDKNNCKTDNSSYIIFFKCITELICIEDKKMKKEIENDFWTIHIEDRDEDAFFIHKKSLNKGYTQE